MSWFGASYIRDLTVFETQPLIQDKDLFILHTILADDLATQEAMSRFVSRIKIPLYERRLTLKKNI